MADGPPQVPLLLVVVPLEGRPSVRSLTTDQDTDRLRDWIVSRPRLAEALAALIDAVADESLSP
jgi:hypothetical protein